MKMLQDKSIVVGTRQSLKHISAGNAELVILAEDTDMNIAVQIRDACLKNNVMLRTCACKKELGKETGIARDAAVVTILKPE